MRDIGQEHGVCVSQQSARPLARPPARQPVNPSGNSREPTEVLVRAARDPGGTDSAGDFGLELGLGLKKKPGLGEPCGAFRGQRAEAEPEPEPGPWLILNSTQSLISDGESVGFA